MSVHEIIEALKQEPNQMADVHGIVIDGNKLYLFYEGKVCEIIKE